MVLTQLLPNGVTDEQVLALMQTIPREQFVDTQQQSIAYADTQLNISQQQSCSTPLEIAKILQGLAIKKTDRVLLVGAGNGYEAALLARLASHVDCIDKDMECIAHAHQVIHQIDVMNVTCDQVQSLTDLGTQVAPDVILVLGSYKAVPNVLLTSLAEYGRLSCVVGDLPMMHANIYQREGKRAWSQQLLFQTCLPRSIYAEEETSFHF